MSTKFVTIPNSEAILRISRGSLEPLVTSTNDFLAMKVTPVGKRIYVRDVLRASIRVKGSTPERQK